MSANVNFDPRLEKETRVPLGIGITVLLTILSCSTVALRLYTKKVILRHVRSDDYVILLAQVLSLGVAIVNILCFTIGGYGRHIQFVMDKMPTFLKLLYAAMAVYNATQIATKIALLLQYRHIFPSRGMRAVCNWGVGLLLLWGVAQQVYTACGCGIIQMYNPKQVACIRPDIPFLLSGSMNMVTDFAILIIPVKPIVQLQINAVRKAYLLIVMCLGLIVCAISAVRLDLLVKNQQNTDGTWELAVTAVLSIVETNLGIMCACIPTLRPLIKKVAPVLVGSSNKDTTGYGKSTRLDDENTRKQKSSAHASIYIQKDVTFHSTTELRTPSNVKDPYAIDDRSSDEISLQNLQPSSSSKP